MIGINDIGLRVGQYHQRAKLSDRDVELIRQLREDKVPRRIVAEKFDVSESTVEKITSFKRRNQVPARFKRPR